MHDQLDPQPNAIPPLSPPPAPGVVQSAVGNTVQPPPPAAAPATPAPAQQLPPLQTGHVRRIARLLLRRIFYGGEVAGRLLSPHLGWLIAVAVLIGIILFQSFLLVVPRLMAAVGGDTRAELLPPAAAVVNFLEGQAAYDADLMWDSFSPALQDALISRGTSKEDLAAQAESERLAGQRYRKFEYIGGVPLDGSHRLYFYVVDIDSPAPERNGRFSFIFTVDRDGKILNLKMDTR